MKKRSILLLVLAVSFLSLAACLPVNEEAPPIAQQETPVIIQEKAPSNPMREAYIELTTRKELTFPEGTLSPEIDYVPNEGWSKNIWAQTNEESPLAVGYGPHTNILVSVPDYLGIIESGPRDIGYQETVYVRKFEKEYTLQGITIPEGSFILANDTWKPILSIVLINPENSKVGDFAGLSCRGLDPCKELYYKELDTTFWEGILTWELEGLEGFEQTPACYAKTGPIADIILEDRDWGVSLYVRDLGKNMSMGTSGSLMEGTAGRVNFRLEASEVTWEVISEGDKNTGPTYKVSWGQQESVTFTDPVYAVTTFPAGEYCNGETCWDMEYNFWKGEDIREPIYWRSSRKKLYTGCD